MIDGELTHLHVHSHFSLLGGTASIGDLVQRAAADGLCALALTDTDVLYGAVAFDRACRAADLRPIIGMTVPVAHPEGEAALETAVPGRVVLLAMNEAGYRALCRLSSLLQAGLERERLRRCGLAWETLKAHQEGLICLCGGRDGWMTRYWREGHAAAAARIASRLGGIFQERCYLSFSPDLGGNQAVGELLQIGERFGVEPVAVQPVYCLRPEEAPRLRLLAAMDRLAAGDESSAPFPGAAVEDATHHWLSPDEMATRYAAFPEALANVGRISRRCGAVLPRGRTLWPALDLPPDETADEALSRRAQEGLWAIGAASHVATAVYEARLAHELAAIARDGFAPLFLLVADIVRFARANDIPVNTRGSVANSLVAHCVGITNVDPVVHDLLFERFLNPARTSLPDIDLDLCSRRRDEVLAYVRRTYGEERVALVATVSTLQPKSAVREVGKVYGLSEAQIKKLTARLPHHWHPDPRRREQTVLEEVLAGLEDDLAREVVTAAYELVGQPHHLSIHPGGIVVTPERLTDVVPLQMAPKGFVTTQYDHRDLETLGLPKIDLLGIRALTVLSDTSDLVRRYHDAAFRLAAVPPDDEETAALLSRAETIGVFQCESEGAQRTLRQLRVRNVADLAIANAFFKPGPATGGMARSFIRRYRGEEAVSFLHPALEPILGRTKGVLLFQEQILRIAREVAGLTWQQADYLRRGMSKFQAREMAAMRLSFIGGCQMEAGFTAEQAETLWEQVAAFAGYGFNQGHATAYADVSYRSAYLKAHYPAEFLCARLADRGGFHHQAVYIAEARRLGLTVRPPHVNVSGRKFTLTRDGAEPVLWMGLGQVRALRRSAVQAIGAAREKRPFAGLRDLLARVDLHGKEVRHLIQCGALDGLGESRAALLAEAEEVARAGSVRQLAFGFAGAAVAPPESAAQRLAWETHVLGLPLSVNPLALADAAQVALALAELPARAGKQVTIAGYRLPGWTGGRGFFLTDGQGLIIAKAVRGAGGKRPYWQPLLLRGRWVNDAWGGGWFQAETVERL